MTDDADAPTVVGILAERARMTEGQLYTLVIAAVVVLLLSVTGLPSAHRLSSTVTPSPPPAPTTTAAP